MVADKRLVIGVYIKQMLDCSKKNALTQESDEEIRPGYTEWKEEQMELCWRMDEQGGSSNRANSQMRQAQPSSHLIWHLPNILCVYTCTVLISRDLIILQYAQSSLKTMSQTVVILLLCIPSPLYDESGLLDSKSGREMR